MSSPPRKELRCAAPQKNKACSPASPTLLLNKDDGDGQPVRKAIWLYGWP